MRPSADVSPVVNTDPARATGWWTRPFQMFQTNLREIDATMDVDLALDAIQAHGANTWLINAGGILAFHPSDLDCQTRNPHLAERPGGDLLGDAIAAAHARGVRVMARMDFSKITQPIADAHPEWCFRSSAGELQVYEGLVSVCPSGDYYQRKTFEILTEVLDRYPVDGFFFNWFSFNEVDYGGVRHGVCHCEACREALTTRDLALPTDPGGMEHQQWRAYCEDVLDDLSGRMRDHIAARRPDAALILRRRSDVIFHEANNKVGRELWHPATSEAVSASKTLLPRVPVLVNAVAFVDMPYRLAGEEPEHYAHYFVQAIARGANPSTYVMGPPGAVDYPGLPPAGEITRFHRDHRRVYDGLVPAAEVALVRPDPLTVPPDHWIAARAEFCGWYSALQESHLPFDVLPAAQLATAAENGTLARFRAVLLPDVGRLSPDAADALDRYTDDGGSVVASGSSGVDDDGSIQLACLPGLQVETTVDGFIANRSSYFAGPAGVLPVHGTRRELIWRDGVETAMELLPQAPFGPPEKAYGHRPVDSPGLVTGKLGAGRGLQFTWTVGRAYRELATTNLRTVMIAAVEDAAGRQPSTASRLPEQVELIMGRSPAGTVLHLLNYSGARRNSFGPPVRITAAELRLSAEIGAHAYALLAGAFCPTRPDGDDLLVELPPLGRFETLVVSPHPIDTEELTDHHA